MFAFRQSSTATYSINGVTNCNFSSDIYSVKHFKTKIHQHLGLGPNTTIGLCISASLDQRYLWHRRGCTLSLPLNITPGTDSSRQIKTGDRNARWRETRRAVWLTTFSCQHLSIFKTPILINHLIFLAVFRNESVATLQFYVGHQTTLATIL